MILPSFFWIQPVYISILSSTALCYSQMVVPAFLSALISKFSWQSLSYLAF